MSQEQDVQRLGHPPKLLFRLGAVLIGAFLIFLLIVPLLGPCWHLLYGDAISYEGWRVPVPRGFYVRNSQNGPTMWKQTFGTPFFSTSYGHISLYNHPNQQPFAYDRDYSRFERGVTEVAAQSGYRFESEHTVPVGRNSAYCLEFTRSVGEPSLLRCAVENSVVVLFYEGDPRYIPNVFTTLQGMSQESPSVPQR